MIDSRPAAATIVGRRRTWPAVLLLYLLAALIPESIATGNTPVLSYLTNPFGLLFLVAFYGGADVAIRELRLRRGLRWGGVLALAFAFGFANEGVVAATWYRVAPTGYAYLGGVDVAWAVLLTLFHAVFSVVVPIALVERMFPVVAGQTWVRRRGLVVAAFLPIALSLLTLLATTYRPQRIVVLALIALLITGGLRWRGAAPSPRRDAPAPSPRRVRWLAAAWTLAFFAAAYLLPGIAAGAWPHALPALQPVYVVAMLGVFTAGLLVARRWSRRAGWTTRHTLAGMTGLLIPSVALTTANPGVFLGGALLLSLPFTILLIVLARRAATAAAADALLGGHPSAAPPPPDGWSG